MADLISFINTELALNRMFRKLTQARERRVRLQCKLSTNVSISFCITCRDRLHHLKETLPKNLVDNENYPNLDFVILDYNSSDGLDEWLRLNHLSLIQSGRIKYYRTDHPDYFQFSHAKNIAHKLAKGEIVCNLDADNFTGPGFASFLADRFKENTHRVIHASWKNDVGSAGRIATPKDYFLLVGGYEERMVGFGYEDPNLVLRLNNLGLEDVEIERGDYLNAIVHPREESVRNSHQKNFVISHWHNRMFSLFNHFGKFKANQNRIWGKARVTRNFSNDFLDV